MVSYLGVSMHMQTIGHIAQLSGNSQLEQNIYPLNFVFFPNQRIHD